MIAVDQWLHIIRNVFDFDVANLGRAHLILDFFLQRRFALHIRLVIDLFLALDCEMVGVLDLNVSFDRTVFS